MAYSFKGSISFGLVYIPVTLSVCVKKQDIGFNLLDKNTMTRVKYKKTGENAENELKPEDIVKGYEYEKGKYVVFDDKDFERLKTKKDKNITIEAFVDLKTIDPIYYEKSYYVSPLGAERAFLLLLKAMEAENRAGIAKTVLGSKETLIAIRVKDGQMLLSTLFFSAEIQAGPAKAINEELKPQELELAKSIIKNMEADFKPENYKDEYRERVQQAIESKIAGREIVTPKEENTGNVIDLMEALKLSLDKTQKPTLKKKTAVSTRKKA